ncbi:2,3-bisphosphoglycerate-independent phosphoglycerate mutase [bacterium]|nr:2,3-bisphosphoglycerate-independent phosphoglycerate mutase [bacterium]
MYKLLYIVLDGLGDRPCKELDGKTPLESADTPNMDDLARKGKTGLVDTVGPGIAPESDIAVISILGYDAEKYYTGRGPLECFAVGIDVQPGDLAFRVNFATMDENRYLTDRRAGRDLTTEEARALAEEVNSKVKLTSHPAEFKFVSTVGHRGVLWIRCKEGPLSANITNTDPAYDKIGYFGVAKEKFEPYLQVCKPLDNSIEAKRAADLTNEFVEKSHIVLNNAEVNLRRRSQGKMMGNVILTRDAGDKLPQFPNIKELFGLNFACFAEMPVEMGIAMLTGMNIVELPEPTGDPKVDYPLRAEKAIEYMDRYDALYIHLKGPDVPGHDGKAIEKRDSISAIDKYFFGNLLPRINLSKVVIAVTADHSTPCSLKAHSDDPVPLLVAGAEIESDGTKAFSEKDCSRGSLGRLLGNQLMPLFIELVRKGED